VTNERSDFALEEVREAKLLRNSACARFQPHVNREVCYRAAFVLPVSSPPIRDGFVAVKAGVVAAVGPVGERPVGSGLSEVDLGCAILMPGFVNAHTHLELSHLEGAVSGDRGFVPWIEEQLRLRAERSVDEIPRAIINAIRDLEARGTVAIADVSNSLAAYEPLRASALHAVVLHEILGFDPEKAGAVFEQTCASRAAVEGESGPETRVHVEIAAHAPHSVSRPLLELLRKSGRGVRSIHVAESQSEVDFLRHGDGIWREFLDRRVGSIPFLAPGLSPIRYLDELGLLTPGLLAVHCIHLDADDARLLAARGAVSVLCPRSNEFLGNGVPPLPLLIENGVRLALGTDSLASAPSLDVLDDARLLARRFTRVPRETLLHAATRGGALALGFDHLGEIREGSAAAFASVSFDGRAPDDPLAFALNEAIAPRAVP
jgi:cytosine/adenosine deaminase-related metal-dependent hydrolase